MQACNTSYFNYDFINHNKLCNLVKLDMISSLVI